MSVIRIARNSSRRVAVVADRGVVDGQERERLGVVDPHRHRARLEEHAVAGLAAQAGLRLLDPCHVVPSLPAKYQVAAYRGAAAAMHDGCPNRSRCSPRRCAGSATPSWTGSSPTSRDSTAARRCGWAIPPRSPRPSAARRPRPPAIPTRSSRRCSRTCCPTVSGPTTARFFARIGSPSTYVGALAEAAAAGVNAFAGVLDRRLGAVGGRADRARLAAPLVRDARRHVRGAHVGRLDREPDRLRRGARGPPRRRARVRRGLRVRPDARVARARRGGCSASARA